jgi:hypothetical protein
VELAQLVAVQSSCADCLKGCSSPALRVLDVKINGADVMVDVSSGVFRPLVPRSFRRHIFDAIHGLAHPGIPATRRLIASQYVWPQLAADVKSWCNECQQCQAAKVTKQPTAAAQSITVPTARFTHVHLDLMGPLSAAADGSTHIITMVDRSSRWAEATPLSTTTAAACLDAFYATWVARYGVPAAVTTDRGSQFTSGLWSSALKKLGVRHLLTAAYHPQSNGLVERLHRRLKDALKARLAGPNCPAHLPWAMLGLRAAPREDSGVSPAELTFGAALSLPATFLDNAERDPEHYVRQLQSFIPCAAPIQLPASAQQPLPDNLLRALHVYVRAAPAAPALSPAYRGPYKVVSRGPKTFKVTVGSKTEVISVDRLKPHNGDDPRTASPPARGRPPSSAMAPPP